MIASNSIKLTINPGEGITQSIDRQLEKDFDKDITLKKPVWEQIINVVKNDRPEQPRQYSGESTDISNGKHFRVQEGFYEISQNAWTQIKQLVSNALNIATTANEATENTITQENTETAEDAVSKLVSIDKTTEPELFNDLVEKYLSIKEADENISNDMLTLRLNNYVKGYNTQQIVLKQKAEQESVYTYVDNRLENTDNRATILNANVKNILKQQFNDNKIAYDSEKVKTNKDLQQHFKTLSLQYLELRDSDSSCDLDFFEIFTNNLANEYIKKGNCQSYSDAIKQAKEYVETNKQKLSSQYEQWIANNTADITENTSMEEILALNSFIELTKLDRTNDKKLDVDEVAEFLLAKSTYTDGENPDYDISTADDFAFESDLILQPEKLDSYLKEAHKFMTTRTN